MTDAIDDPNPYRSPESHVGEGPSYVLHPIRGVMWATLWGGLVAGGVVMAINYWRSGKQSAGRIVLILGFLATAAFLGTIFVIPEETLDRIPNLVFWIPQMALAYVVAHGFQKDIIETHLSNGGAVASAWPSVGIGALCLPVTLLALIGVAYILEPSFGTVVEFGDDEIYYSGDATEDDARKLAEVLEDEEWFGVGGASVRLESSSGEFTVSFVLIDHAWSNPEIIEALRELGKAIVASGFPSPLTVQMCDEYFDVKNSIVIE